MADLIKMLSERLAAFMSKPREWRPSTAAREAQEAAIDAVARETYSRLHTMLKDRLFHDRLAAWGRAFDHRGPGSTFVRARDIRGIYENAAAIPGETPDPEASEFLDVVRDMFRQAAEAAGAEVM